MSIRDKYNKSNTKQPPLKNAATALLNDSVNVELQKDVNTEIKVTPKKATFLLDAALHTQLKTSAAIEGRPMAEIVTDALKKYFEQTK